MNLTLQRREGTGLALPGTLTLNGMPECCTLENTAVCIPAGTYPIDIYDSPHAGHKVPILADVPGRSFVEIHCGDFPCDSKGCILTGEEVDDNRLYNSHLAFAHLMPQITEALDNGEAVTITVLER